jgi:hypothetical protein
MRQPPTLRLSKARARGRLTSAPQRVSSISAANQFRNSHARRRDAVAFSQPIIEARRVLTESASRISQAVLAVSNFS